MTGLQGQNNIREFIQTDDRSKKQDRLSNPVLLLKKQIRSGTGSECKEKTADPFILHFVYSARNRYG